MRVTHSLLIVAAAILTLSECGCNFHLVTASLNQSPHTIDTLALLFQIGMYVEVEGGADVGVA